MNISAVLRRVRGTCLGLALGMLSGALLPVQAAERGPVRRAMGFEASTVEARVIVKFKAGSTLMQALSATGGSAEIGAGSGADSEGPQQAGALSSRLGMALTDGRPLGARVQVVRGAGLTSAQLAAKLAAEADIEYAVVDGRKQALGVIPNDALFGPQTGSVTPAVGQWYLQAPTATWVSSINATAAWGTTLGSASIVVADLDTGVRFDHPDLASKLLPGYDFVGGDNTPKSIAIANDGDGRDSDASDPGDWITAAEANLVGGNFYHCGPKDSGGNYVGENSTWHGTQTAGLIGAATDNAIGMAGVGRNVMVQPLRVLGKCGGYDSDIIAAMKWAAGISVPGIVPAVNPTPARVINLSLGGAEACSTAYQDAVNDLASRNVVVVAAVGNDGLAPGAPANCTGVVAVAGVRQIGTKVGYSNLGAGVTISAPAGNCVNSTGTCLFPVLTTSNSGTQGPVTGAAGAIYTDGGANASLGTSFSAPIVAGTVALMISANPSMTPAQIKSALMGTARSFPSTGAASGVQACTAPSSTAQSSECYCTTDTCGAGLLDAGAAVAAAAALAPVMASISASTYSVIAGASANFDGRTSASGLGGLAYQWSITAGNALASFSSATNASTVTVLTSAAGSVTVTLTVTDSAGRSASSSAVLTVTAPAVVVPNPPVTSSGGGGGGAMSIFWLMAWLLAVAAVWHVAPRQRL